jgi:drug/metabolite transporter (DMT)-like permease
MKPKLKEDPREWRKFAWAALAVLGFAALALWRRGTLSLEGFLAVAGAVLLLAVGAALRPQPVRPVYRVAMTAGFYLGQVMGRLLLALAFLLVVTPLGVMLRLAGKDLLRLRRDRRNASYWQPARFTSQFDRQF